MKLRPFFLAVFCSIVVSFPPCPAEAEDPASAAGEHLSSPSSLIDDYRLALTVDPDNLILHYSLGSALLAEGLDREAVVELRRAYPAFGDSARMNLDLGLAHSRTGDLDSALLYFDQAETLGGSEKSVLFSLANGYYALGLASLETDAPDEAAVLFEKSLALDPERQEIHRQLAEIYARKGLIEQALSEFETYLKIYPDDAATREFVYTLYFNRARQSMEKGAHRAARNDFNKALDANPESPLAIYYLSCLDQSEGNYEGAADRLAKIYGASPAEIRQSMDSLLHDCAQFLLKQKKLREALTAVKPLIDRQSADPQDLTMAGNIHLCLKEFEAALTCFERALALDTSHGGAIAGIAAARDGAVEELLADGRALALKGDYPEALRRVKAALAIDPAHSAALACAEEIRPRIDKETEGFFTLAEESLRRGRPHVALEQIGEGLILTPDSHRGLDLRERALGTVAVELTEILKKGDRLLEEGSLQEAEEAFAGILHLDPSNEEARNAKERVERILEEKALKMAAQGNLALEDGRLSNAREAFETSLKLVPELREAQEGLARIEVLISAMISEEVQWGRRARSAGRLRQAREHFADALRMRDDAGLRDEMGAIDRRLAERRLNLMDAARRSLEMEDLKAAGDYFCKALALSPGDPDALQGLAEVETRIPSAIRKEIDAAEEDRAAQRFPRALGRYRHVLDLEPSSKTARDGVGLALKKMEEDLGFLVAAGKEGLAGGLFEEAQTAFREALFLDPWRSEARRGLRRLERLRDAGRP